MKSLYSISLFTTRAVSEWHGFVSGWHGFCGPSARDVGHWHATVSHGHGECERLAPNVSLRHGNSNVSRLGGRARSARLRCSSFIGPSAREFV